MLRQYVHKSMRPNLAIENNGGSRLGNCYEQCKYKVISRERLSKDTLHKLRDLGFLGFGQEFYINSKCDGSEEPEIIEESPCVVVDAHNGKELDEPPINPYSGKLYESMKQYYFVYHVESRVDSSD